MNSTDSKLSCLAEQANEAHREAQHCYRTGVAHAERAGKALLKAKANIPHGKWSAWLSTNFEGSERLAQLYMRMARRLPELDDEIRNEVAEMSLREAAVALSEPRAPHVIRVNVVEEPLTTVPVSIRYSEQKTATSAGVSIRSSMSHGGWDVGLSQIVSLVDQARVRSADDVAARFASSDSVTSAELEGLAAWLADIAVSLGRLEQEGDGVRRLTAG